MERRVVVTGIGVVSALGKNAHQFWEALVKGESGIRRIEQVDVTGLKFQNGAEAHNWEPQEHFESKQLDFVDRFAQFAVVAAREAVADAGIQWTQSLREQTAIVTGSCVGGKATEDDSFQELYLRKKTRVSPLTIMRTMENAGASHISIETGITGPAFTLSTACSSANHAVGQAFRMVRSGDVEMALAGGSEAPFNFGHLKAWEAMRVVAPDTCRPFCADRLGMVLGEGGAMMVLENREAALARGAHIYGEIVGFGMSSDAHHLTQASTEGPARAITAALRDASLQAEQIGYINAHGTATQVNDPAEVAAIRLALGGHAERVAVSSTKSMHGHALGAAGAIEAIATILALRNSILPPTANFTKPDPRCDIDVIPNTARRAEVEYALSNSFAFGGLNAVLAFRSPR
ncbi:MAG TPA: beta-ketoacyl-[acyl-carrier-protein] synthase family protein [Spirochaetia bacterium]|nr:beta-ketoacyl-[acyl-carrier-protein] synthase family protein [Spirochaetia bacterium]